jgi:predicted nucleic acid-binding protein
VGEQNYAGHVLFGGTYPHIRVFQVYVIPKHRRRRIASLLVQSLIRDAEDDGYLSISARVATDLGPANAFWQHEGFVVARCKPGGSSRARMLNIRVRELDTPRLFEWHQEPAGLRSAGIPSAGLPAVPSYIIDVNVFLDLMKNRVNAEEVRRLMAASWTRAVDVIVSEEFVEELRRAGDPSKPDPVLEFASALPRLPGVPKSVIQPLLKTLGPIVFPERTKRNTLSTRDISDLIHIATAVHHGANGFVTGEKAILRCGPELRQKFGIDVVGTAEFSNMVAPVEHRSAEDLRLGTGVDDLAISELLEEHRTGVQAFLESLKVPGAIISAALSPGAYPLQRRRMEVRATSVGEFVGYASWDAASRFRAHTEAYVFVDDDHPDARAIATHLFREIVQDISTSGPCVALLKTPEGHVHARAAAVEAGFRSPEPAHATGHELRKIAIGGAITTRNWTVVSNKLKALSGLDLVENIPAFNGPETQIAFTDPKGNKLSLGLMDVEKLLGPAVFLLPGRSGTLVPIRREFADHLFSGAAQLSLLPRRQAGLFTERAYFRAPDRAGLFGVGLPLVFYESLPKGGRGCAFASAVVTTNRIMWAETLSDRVLLKGVLERETLVKMSKNGLVSMLRFDNAIALRKPVGLSRLRTLKAIDAANLVAPRRLDADILAALFSEADTLAL